VIGRYFAMDRDKRWDRDAEGLRPARARRGEHHADSAAQAAQDAYERDETDEFITATTVGEEARSGPATPCSAFNFRPDRMREITRALRGPDVRRDRPRRRDGRALRDAAAVRGGLGLPVVFPPQRPAMTIARSIADRGLRQLHVAETRSTRT
jgi:2,3-bisphosphoglycerate-independent phosphoglycerate mutase